MSYEDCDTTINIFQSLHPIGIDLTLNQIGINYSGQVEKMDLASGYIKFLENPDTPSRIVVEESKDAQSKGVVSDLSPTAKLIIQRLQESRELTEADLQDFIEVLLSDPILSPTHVMTNDEIEKALRDVFKIKISRDSINEILKNSPNAFLYVSGSGKESKAIWSVSQEIKGATPILNKSFATLRDLELVNLVSSDSGNEALKILDSRFKNDKCYLQIRPYIGIDAIPSLIDKLRGTKMSKRFLDFFQDAISLESDETKLQASLILDDYQWSVEDSRSPEKILNLLLHHLGQLKPSKIESKDLSKEGKLQTQTGKIVIEAIAHADASQLQRILEASSKESKSILNFILWFNSEVSSSMDPKVHFLKDLLRKHLSARQRLRIELIETTCPEYFGELSLEVAKNIFLGDQDRAELISSIENRLRSVGDTSERLRKQGNKASGIEKVEIAQKALSLSEALVMYISYQLFAVDSIDDDLDLELISSSRIIISAIQEENSLPEDLSTQFLTQLISTSSLSPEIILSDRARQLFDWLLKKSPEIDISASRWLKRYGFSFVSIRRSFKEAHKSGAPRMAAALPQKIQKVLLPIQVLMDKHSSGNESKSLITEAIAESLLAEIPKELLKLRDDVEIKSSTIETLKGEIRSLESKLQELRKLNSELTNKKSLSDFEAKNSAGEVALLMKLGANAKTTLERDALKIVLESIGGLAVYEGDKVTFERGNHLPSRGFVPTKGEIVSILTNGIAVRHSDAMVWIIKPEVGPLN